MRQGLLPGKDALIQGSMGKCDPSKHKGHSEWGAHSASPGDMFILQTPSSVELCALAAGLLWGWGLAVKSP